MWTRRRIKLGRRRKKQAWTRALAMTTVDNHLSIWQTTCLVERGTHLVAGQE